MEPNNQFWQFSDNLRLQSNNLSNLSLNDSIWSTKQDQRRNFDFKNDGVSSFAKNPINNNNSSSSNDGNNMNMGGNFSYGSGLNGGFNKGVYSNSTLDFNGYYGNYGSKGKGFGNNSSFGGMVNNKGGKNEVNGGNGYGVVGKIGGKKSKGSKENGGESKSAVDKRFKTLPAAESLPRNETIGGYIFVCNNDTMAENLKRQLFGLPPRYRDSVRAITPGLPLFLYNYSTHQLHGVFEAASFGGANIDPSAWEDKKNPGESRFPAQVRVVTRKVCEPMEEDSFRPILHHYDGPKFRLELNVPEALSLLDIFAENKA